MKQSKIGAYCTIGLCSELIYRIEGERPEQYFVVLESTTGRDGALIRGWVSRDRITLI